jgi:cell wall-associated NlpC family hydrolase
MFAAGEAAQPGEFDPGDFILTHGSAFYSKLIRFGQGLRYWGKNRKYTRWNHAAMIVSEKGDLIEALGCGVRQTHIDKYKPTEYHLVRLGALADRRDREQVVAFARWCLGEKYGWLTIVSIAFTLLFGGKLDFGIEGQTICSGLVARAVERTNAIFDRTPSHIMPADLARYFEVQPPPKGTSKGVIPQP